MNRQPDTRQDTAPGPPGAGSPFNPLKIVLPVLAALLAISLMAQWYASHVSLPRYCDDPDRALRSLQRLLQDQASLDRNNRRRDMIAAKLLYLLPQQSGESERAYLQRLRYRLLSECAR